MTNFSETQHISTEKSELDETISREQISISSAFIDISQFSGPTNNRCRALEAPPPLAPALIILRVQQNFLHHQPYSVFVPCILPSYSHNFLKQNICRLPGREGAFRDGKREDFPDRAPRYCVVIGLTLFYQLAENDMLVDDYEQYPAERTDVVVVSRSGSDEPESAPTADDRTFFVASPSLNHNHKQEGVC